MPRAAISSHTRPRPEVDAFSAPCLEHATADLPQSTKGCLLFWTNDAARDAEVHPGPERVLDQAFADSAFCFRRHQPRRPPPAKTKPGSPAPTMGPGTAWVGGPG